MLTHDFCKCLQSCFKINDVVYFKIFAYLHRHLYATSIQLFLRLYVVVQSKLIAPDHSTPATKRLEQPNLTEF